MNDPRTLDLARHITRVAYPIAAELTGFTPPDLGALERQMQARWYDDEHYGNSDIYGSDEYLWCAIACFRRVTWLSVRSFSQWVDVTGQRPSSIVDVWAGCGLATAMIASLFPADVTYHNAAGKQALVAERLFRALKLDIQIVNEPVSAQTVVAFEAMEHFWDPCVEIDKFISDDTRVYADCSSFAYQAAGHFDAYLCGSETYRRKKFRRHFNAHLVARHGFHRSGVKFWQGRPTIFTKSVQGDR